MTSPQGTGGGGMNEYEKTAAGVLGRWFRGDPEMAMALRHSIAIAIEEAVAAERKRCAGIVQLARHGEIDSDFRCIVSRIEGGDSLKQIESED